MPHPIEKKILDRDLAKKYISHQALELSVAFKTKYAGYCSQRAVYHTQVIAKTAQQKVS